MGDVGPGDSDVDHRARSGSPSAARRMDHLQPHPGPVRQGGRDSSRPGSPTAPRRPGLTSTPESVEACFTRLADEGYRSRSSTCPPRRFWPLQLVETGVLLALARPADRLLLLADPARPDLMSRGGTAMIWLTWRQFRASASSCWALWPRASWCSPSPDLSSPSCGDEAGENFFGQLGADGLKSTIFYAGTWIVYALPVVVGVFWGAPMIARELEAGTSRLVWTQSITRTRWLATKLGVTGIGRRGRGPGRPGPHLVVCARSTTPSPRATPTPGLLSVPRLWPQLFGSRGVVPLGMTVLALVIGVTAGLLVRRSIAAMAVTLVAVVAVQLLLPIVVQPHLLAPEAAHHHHHPGAAHGVHGKTGPGATRWSSSGSGSRSTARGLDHLQPHGRQLRTAWSRRIRPGSVSAPRRPGRPAADSQACFDRLAAEGYRQRVEYQPAVAVLAAPAGARRGSCSASRRC